MTHNATPAASVSALKRTHTPKPKLLLHTEIQTNVSKLQKHIPPFQRKAKRHLVHQTPQTMFRFSVVPPQLVVELLLVRTQTMK